MDLIIITVQQLWRTVLSRYTCVLYWLAQSKYNIVYPIVIELYAVRC